MVVYSEDHREETCRRGRIEVICGSMFSGKTEELIRRLRRATFAHQRVEIFKPSIDTRYSEEEVVSHDNNSIKSTPIDSSASILLFTSEIDVVGIDEAQFFDDGLPEVCNELANRGVRVIIAGALFGLFNTDETEFTEETAILTSESNEEGIFTFENVPYGEYIVRELKPAEGYLPNEENYQVTISNNEEIIEITVENDKIPKLKTTATIDGKKEVGTTEVFTLEDVVEYKHLVPGKEYKVKGILMDKTTGEPLLIDEKEIRS